MRNRLRDLLEAFGDLFWVRPGCIVMLGVLLGLASVWFEGASDEIVCLPAGWAYSGGEAGARALLAAIASSSIGVAGTIFSITVAALSLASGQMGPRLLRNFTRDGGNQIALGIFVGTFAYALVVLRSVRSVGEGPFVPHLGVTGALALALLCVATLIWFVHHIANGINVDIVIDLVHRDLLRAIKELTSEVPSVWSPATPLPGAPISLQEGGYLRTVDDEALADWAKKHETVVTLLVRPGAYVSRGVPVAEVADPAAADAAKDAIIAAFSVGSRQAAVQDLEFAVRQLVEVAVRALSPGINDPFTAMSVLDRLGDALCEMAPRHLPSNVVLRSEQVVVYRQVTDYEGLCNAMFHMIRQNAGASASVLIRLIDILAMVLKVEAQSSRQVVLKRHARLALLVGRANIADPAGIAGVEAHFASIDTPPSPTGGWANA